MNLRGSLKRPFSGIFLLFVVLSLAVVTASAQNGAFTYQGRFNDGAAPAMGTFNMQFSLWDSVSGGTQIGSTISNTSVSANNGVFTVTLDFGTPFTAGADRFLEIAVKKPADGSYTTLAPRQPVLNAPYATVARSLVAERATGTNPGNLMTIFAGSSAAGSTDINGGSLLLNGGLGTGLGGGGNVRIQTAGANDLSGTTDNLLVDRMIHVARAKQLTLSAPGFTSLMSIHLTGTHTAGGRIFYMVRATDGGSQIATEEGVIQYLATANSITCTVQTTDKLHLGTVNSGCTPGFFNPSSQPGVSIFDNVTFSSPAPIVVHEVYFTIENDSGSAIRLEP